MENVTQKAQVLQTFFGSLAEQIARQTGLVQRASALTGSLIFQIVVLGFIQSPTASYTDLALVAAALGVSITPQALEERLNKWAAPHFFRAMFEQACLKLSNQRSLPLDLISQFEAVYLLDSTQVGLPDHLAQRYPGSGGDGPKAGLKLQVCYEMLGGQVAHFSQEVARRADQGYRAYLTQVQSGSLILFDLGYFCLASFADLALKKAYWVSRLSSEVSLWEVNGRERFDLLAYLRKQLPSQAKWELDLLVGTQTKVGGRVIVVRLPSKIVEERRRKLKLRASKRGKAYSQAYLERCNYNFYFSNVEAERASLEQIVRLYELRWQVELLFKLWKSQGALDRVAGRKEGRILSEIYAKLSGMVVFNYLSGPLRYEVGGFELSPVKAWHTFQLDIIALGQEIRSKESVGLVVRLKQLEQNWRKYGGKQKRRKNQSSLKQLELIWLTQDLHRPQAGAA